MEKQGSTSTARPEYGFIGNYKVLRGDETLSLIGRYNDLKTCVGVPKIKGASVDAGGRSIEFYNFAFSARKEIDELVKGARRFDDLDVVRGRKKKGFLDGYSIVSNGGGIFHSASNAIKGRIKVSHIPSEGVDIKNKVVCSNLRLVRRVLKGKINGSSFLDDYFQELVYALDTAVDNFDVNIGVKFSTYAANCIGYSVRDVGAGYKPFPFHGELYNEDGEFIDIEDSRSSGLEKFIADDFYGKSLRSLDKRESKILRLWTERESLENIGKVFGISKERVRQIKNNAIAFLKKKNGVSF